MIAKTPKPPYYAVIFTSIKNEEDKNYNSMSKKMLALAQKEQGFLGVESARSEIGITVSYWDNIDAIKKWKNNSEHSIARKQGKSKWYQKFKVRICKVERDYEFEK